MTKRLHPWILSHGSLPFDPLLELSAERVTSPPPLPMVNRYVRHQWIPPTAGDSLLSRSGAILFRGFPVSGARTKTKVIGDDQFQESDPSSPIGRSRKKTFLTYNKTTAQERSADLCDDCSKILDEECVALQWQKDDDLLLDKLTVLNSQRPLTMVSVLEIDLQFDILDELTYVKHHLSNVSGSI
ncbi:hypothetical protein R6Q57_029654 [Mikania cordata]